jgi:hypothetical protein
MRGDERVVPQPRVAGSAMAATWNVSDLVAGLPADPWRKDNPFSADVAECHRILFDASRSRSDRIAALSTWLAQNQPCLFGRLEAKQNRLAFCMLTENDLERSDQEIRAKIQRERLDWKRSALAAESHGFLIAAVSERIAAARPGPELLELAKYLCNLYLGVDEPDTIHLDDVILEIASREQIGWKRWKVGVNYFSSQGDGRWWRDHRIPGGIAFSMNSVGHMARSLVEREVLKNPGLAARCGEVGREKLVYWALRFAMKTIGPPIEGSDRATWLSPRGTFPEDREPPCFDDRDRYFGDLASFSENRYKGLYHTDETIPSAYFDEALWRREELRERDDLYFTYLDRLSDEDYQSMGVGEEFEIGKAGGLASEDKKKSEP